MAQIKWSRDPNTLIGVHRENSCYLATVVITRYTVVCCEAQYTVGYHSDSLTSCFQTYYRSYSFMRSDAHISSKCQHQARYPGVSRDACC